MASSGGQRYLLAAVLGFCGVILCVLAVAIIVPGGVWLMKITDRSFTTIDESLAAVEERLESGQQRLQESKITMDGLMESLRSKSREEIGERLTEQLDVVEKSDQLAERLEQAGSWLEVACKSLESVEHGLELGQSLGAPTQPSLVRPLREKLEDIQLELAHSLNVVEQMQDRLSGSDDGDQPERSRLRDAAQIAVRVVATLGELDERLGDFNVRLADTRDRAGKLEAKTRTYVLVAMIVALLLTLWMAAGQISLCRHGWRTYRDRAKEMG